MLGTGGGCEHGRQATASLNVSSLAVVVGATIASLQVHRCIGQITSGCWKGTS
jgi:hypothetical protein